MATILEQIVEQTAVDLKKRQKKVLFKDFESMECYERDRRDFAEALEQEDTVSIIAEIKKASPSKGLIRKGFDPQRIAGQYREGGAAALSVLTDEPAFKGHLEYLETASKEVDIPVLRKDFIIDPYQVKEARAYGADAVLLIATITEGNQLSELFAAAEEFELQALVEVYSEKDLEVVDFEEVYILGANNRDLHTFEVDVHRGIELLHKANKGTVLVSESGLGSPEDIKLLYDEQINAALIGEYFMRQQDPGQAVKNLLEGFEELKEKEKAFE
ncbi:indole-3-glycerol phosphate synthase TrpC [Aliifodinibius sp. S!AR15-10]|uniref:indole-3-glycerol phosphate synthase TrpC n=1 Tax=Aliifodinibius sp. S!AR15-10 TaxID=2950437 RepID=UPI00285F6FD8|nr:indole-3-glycerol phosphate synthase TrpC [Aliifodinibius sp. S!AR15-10]MDR8392333.1 indole-3-glycerol phosphate synthase TrpC [Aliifodinibius sp. S!AR15-10]